MVVHILFLSWVGPVRTGWTEVYLKGVASGKKAEAEGQLDQGYRNTYNLIECEHEKELSFVLKKVPDSTTCYALKGSSSKNFTFEKKN